ncbi:3611_t:CDS:2 [Cetraspora pellucida]|uniref:3611_t:CDS:1 n=1 Tax=Cetraspora pellucida TaxID=1433469 RepID=A0A9N8YU91_9GLOM|nr:3611_t:CDS:2 [Cetraspora pellucida]
MGNRISKSRKNQSHNYANELASSNNSSRTIDKFAFEDGRRFHNVDNSKYFLPNDDDECDRLHVMHFTYKFIWRGNFSAPIEDLLKQEGTRVLDVGLAVRLVVIKPIANKLFHDRKTLIIGGIRTGAGSWLLEMSTNYPLARFTGVDISPIQPGYIKPKNAEFIEANVLESLPFDNDTFDFVFQRLLFAGIPGNEWPSVINELVRVLKPGGYIEMFNERGLDTHICYKLQSYLKQNKQLHNVHYKIKQHYDDEDAEKLFRLPKLMSLINVSSDEYDNLIKDMKNEIIELRSFNAQDFKDRHRKYRSGRAKARRAKGFNDVI